VEALESEKERVDVFRGFLEESAKFAVSVVILPLGLVNVVHISIINKHYLLS
jgi:hypothetical protein